MTSRQIQRYPRYPTNVPVEILEPESRRGWRLSLDNISLGGAFVRELVWVPLGAQVIVRLPVSGGIETVARAMHVVDTAAGARKGHPAGAGLQFEGLSADGRSKLVEFVEAISAAAHFPAEPPRKPQAASDTAELTATIAHRVGPGVLELRFTSVAEVLDLWVRHLSKGRLFVHSQVSLEMRAPVRVVLKAPHGTFELETETVHVLKFDPPSVPPFGVGLQLDGFAALRQRLEQFARGAVDVPVEAPQPVVPLEVVLQEVRRFFDAVDRGDIRGALGVGPDATATEERSRLLELKALFSRTPGGATAPKLARLDAALRALTRIERQLGVRDGSVAGELVVFEQDAVTNPEPMFVPPAVAPSVPPPPAIAPVRARAVIPEPVASEYAPPAPAPKVDDDPLMRRRKLVGEAEMLIIQAEVYASEDQRDAVREMVDRALKLATCTEALMLRAVAACKAVDDFGRAVSIAQRIVQYDPENAAAWRLLLSIYETKGHLALAMRAAKALLDLDPTNSALKARIAKFRTLVRHD